MLHFLLLHTHIHACTYSVCRPSRGIRNEVALRRHLRFSLLCVCMMCVVADRIGEGNVFLVMGRGGERLSFIPRLRAGN